MCNYCPNLILDIPGTYMVNSRTHPRQPLIYFPSVEVSQKRNHTICSLLCPFLSPAKYCEVPPASQHQSVLQSFLRLNNVPSTAVPRYPQGDTKIHRNPSPLYKTVWYCWPSASAGHALMDTVVVPTLWIMLLWMPMYQSLCGKMILILLGRCPSGTGVIQQLYLASWRTATLTSTDIPSYIPPTGRVPTCLHPASSSVCLSFVAILEGVKWDLAVLTCISLMTNNTEHLFMSFLAICISSLEKCLFKSFAHF